MTTYIVLASKQSFEVTIIGSASELLHPLRGAVARAGAALALAGKCEKIHDDGPFPGFFSY